MMAAVPPPPDDRALPPDMMLVLDPRVTSWSEGAILIGGSPWRISRLAARARAVVADLQRRGAAGLRAGHDLAVFRELVDRGFAFPLPGPNRGASSCSVLVPAKDRAQSLERCLASLHSQDITVIDDGSVDAATVEAVANRYRARLIRHPHNRGPAAARNTGLRETTSEFVAFLDSDCVAPTGWPQSMLHHFNDPTLAAVAPRVRPGRPFSTAIERYESARSALDMGRHRELVKPGARLGFVPTAALVVRRSALGGFDERLRLGEDVDLVWRLHEAGWLVRYDPSVTVTHETRSNPVAWLKRGFDYGTSAAALESRHPGNLTPARLSAWNLTALALLAAGQPAGAGVVIAAETIALARQLHPMPDRTRLAAEVVAKGFVADTVAIGHLLRQEWWPIGAAALATVHKSRISRVAALCILAPILWEWTTQRPPIDPARYLTLRLISGAAYGTGVIANSTRSRTIAPLTPAVRLPRALTLRRK